MNMVEIIARKKMGGALSAEEIRFFAQGAADHSIPDYQLAALLMAIRLNGMDHRETTDLTLAMLHSGDVADLSAIPGIKVDKHSTGGVGDTTTLILAPLVAACGVPVAKMSGRGLGHTGGTIDKLESFPGFSTSIPVDLFEKNVREIGFSIMGQTKDLAPADKKLYALRDITAPVDNMSLIASSIMSKKLAAGADAIVLDVKTGSGAFMKKYEDSQALAEEMVKIGNNAGRKTIAVISDMDEPLGFAVGNALEVKEAIETLEGKGPADFTELCLELGSKMLVAGGYAGDDEEAKKKLKDAIDSGKALEKLAAFVKAQGGDSEYVYHTDKLPKASLVIPVYAGESGYISRIICDEVGVCSMILGGGRETKEDIIDLSVGIVLLKKVGDMVEKGEEIAMIHANDEAKAKECMNRLLRAYSFSADPVPAKKVIKTVIGL